MALGPGTPLLREMPCLDKGCSSRALPLFRRFLNWVEFVAQNFVVMYAGVTQEIDLVQPHLEDLDETRIFIADDYDMTGTLMNANFQNARMHVPPPRQASLRYRKFQPSDEKLEEFANYLRDG